MIEIVSPVLVDMIWPKIQKGFRQACDKSGYQFSEGWLHTVCRKGDAYLCLYRPDDDLDDIATAMVLQEQIWCNKQVLNVLAATGHGRHDWWQDVIDWAILNFPGCEDFIFEGRPGWSRMPGVKVLRYVYTISMEPRPIDAEMDTANRGFVYAE